MLLGLLTRFVLVLTSLAFLGGATVQAMPPVASMDMAMQLAAGADGCLGMKMNDAGSKSTPCKKLDLDCIKSMGCLGSPTIPARTEAVSVPVHYGLVTYWSAPSAQAGLSIKPDLFPPIAA